MMHVDFATHTAEIPTGFSGGFFSPVEKCSRNEYEVEKTAQYKGNIVKVLKKVGMRM